MEIRYHRIIVLALMMTYVWVRMLMWFVSSTMRDLSKNHSPVDRFIYRVLVGANLVHFDEFGIVELFIYIPVVTNWIVKLYVAIVLRTDELFMEG